MFQKAFTAAKAAVRSIPYAEPWIARSRLRSWRRKAHRQYGERARQWLEDREELTVRPGDVRYSARVEDLEDLRWESHLRPLGESEGSGPEDGVSLAIGPDGQLVCVGGSSQLLAASDPIRARVLHRHPTWIDFVTEVWGYAYEHDGKIYNLIDHPDLVDVPAMHEWDRLEMVLPRLPFKGGRALDIGTHWGFWCQQLEKVGFECVGLELLARNAYFAERIRDANGCRYQIFNTSVFDHSPRDYDLVIALYIFHHLTKTQALYEQLIDKLRSLEMRAMVFGSHNHDQRAMQTAYRNFTPEEWVDFLLEHSRLTRATHLGTEAGRREIYLLEA